MIIAVVIDPGNSSLKSGLVLGDEDDIIRVTKTGSVARRDLFDCGGRHRLGQSGENLAPHLLRVAPEEHPVLLTEAPLTPKAHRERFTQIMFETFNVPSFFLANSSVLSLYSTGRVTGMVLDVGHSTSYATPVVDGFLLPYYAILRTELAGAHLTACLLKLLIEKGYSFSSEGELEILEVVKDQGLFLELFCVGPPSWFLLCCLAFTNHRGTTLPCSLGHNSRYPRDSVPDAWIYSKHFNFNTTFDEYTPWLCLVHRKPTGNTQTHKVIFWRLKQLQGCPVAPFLSYSLSACCVLNSCSILAAVMAWPKTKV